MNKGLDIEIVKRIPVGAGLAGGSSNASAVLLGLNKLWKLHLSKDSLLRLAKRIGCDVPFFVYESCFAIGSGRGDEIKPLAALKDTKLWHVLVVPKLAVSTPFIYRKWDEDSGLTPHLFGIQRNHKNMNKIKGAGLTMPKFDVKLLTSALQKNALSRSGSFLFNSLEPVTVKYYPKVQAIRNKLRKLGLKTILMSGSGPAVFVIVPARKEAATLARKLKTWDKSLQVFVTGTI